MDLTNTIVNNYLAKSANLLILIDTVAEMVTPGATLQDYVSLILGSAVMQASLIVLHKILSALYLKSVVKVLPKSGVCIKECALKMMSSVAITMNMSV